MTIPTCLYSQQQSFPDHKCRVTLPKGWKFSSTSIEMVQSYPGVDRKMTEVLLVSQRDPQRDAFVLYTEKVVWTAVLRESMTDRVNQNWGRQGWTVSESRMTKLAGVDAMTWRASGRDSIGPVHALGYYLVANGYGYYLVFMLRSGRQTADDRDVQRIVESFQFIGEPELHKPMYTGPARELKFPEHHCAITLPSGWTEGTFGRTMIESMAMVALDSTSRKEIRIEVRPIPGVDVTNSEIVELLLQKMVATEVTNVEHAYVEIAGGRTALAVRGVIPQPRSEPVSSLTVIVGDAQRLYGVFIKDGTGKDLSSDPEIRKIVESFRILE